jgi:hypothetical protein
MLVTHFPLFAAAMAALRGLCISPEFRAVVVREGILDPLVLMSRSEDVMVSPALLSFRIGLLSTRAD